jgi:hypothetical protein
MEGHVLSSKYTILNILLISDNPQGDDIMRTIKHYPKIAPALLALFFFPHLSVATASNQASFDKRLPTTTPITSTQLKTLTYSGQQKKLNKKCCTPTSWQKGYNYTQYVQVENATRFQMSVQPLNVYNAFPASESCTVFGEHENFSKNQTGGFCTSNGTPFLIQVGAVYKICAATSNSAFISCEIDAIDGVPIGLNCNCS